MEKTYKVTFTTLDGNENSVEVQAYSSRRAQEVFEANYEFDESQIVVIEQVED